MDTPAITPEILAQPGDSPSTGPSPPHESATPQSQSQSQQAQAHSHILRHQQTQQPKTQGTTTMDSTFFFGKSLRPLSPPESPFAFDAAFSAKPQQTSPPSSTGGLQTSAPASPHFTLPALVRPTYLSLAKPPTPNLSTARTKRERGWAKAVVPQRTADNPYFPSIAEQERAEKWVRDQARFTLPEPSPPAMVEHSGVVGGADPFSHANSASSASASSGATASSPGEKSGPRFKLDLGDVRRRRALRVCAEVPASPESLENGIAGRASEDEEAYKKQMAKHLAERIRRRSVRPEPWGRRDGEEGRFEW
ncbi:hypothetical protein DPSP01_013736 [Paraphaeosphaeria sporulosa]